MKKLFFIFSSFLLLASIPVTIFVTKQSQELRKKAAPATTLSFKPSTLTKKVNDEFSLEVIIDTGANQVVAVELHIIFDPVKLEAESIINGPQFPNVLAVGTIEQGAGTASITVGAPGSTTPVTGTDTVATIRFKALEKTDAPVAVRFATNTYVNGLGESAENILIGSNPASVTIDSDGTLPENNASPTPTNELSGSAETQALETNEQDLSLDQLESEDATVENTPVTAQTGDQSSDLAITSISENENIIDPQPVIQGKAAPGATVTVTIYSTPQTCVAIADSEGNWSCQVENALEDGPHNIVVTAQDPNGQSSTNSLSFIVASGSQETEPSSATPVAGNLEITMILVTAGVLLIFLGLAYPLDIKKI